MASIDEVRGVLAFSRVPREIVEHDVLLVKDLEVVSSAELI